MRKLLLVPYAMVPKGFATLGDIPQIEALRPSILYWDEVTVPVPMPGMLTRLDGYLDFLRREGVVQTYNVQPTNSFSGQTLTLFANDLISRLAALEGQNDWSALCPVGNQQSLVEYFRRLAGTSALPVEERSHKMLEMAFRDALPVPPEGTAFEDILEFKREREDQLNELNNALEMLAVQLSGVPSLEDALRVGKRNVEGALVAIDRVFSEKWTSRIWSSLQTTFPPAIAGGIVGTLGAPTMALSTMAGAAIGGVAAPAITAVIKSFQSSGKVSERASPFLYAYEAGRDLRRKTDRTGGGA